MDNIPGLFSLKERVAVVTGGAGLLGVEFCRTLARAGAKVVAADSDISAATTLVESLTREGHQALAVKIDVTSPDSVQQMVTKVKQEFDRIDILVNCAVVDPKFDSQHNQHTTTFEEYPLELWNQALSVNLTGMFLCCQAVAKPMVQQGSGVIINLSSIYGLTGPDQRLYQYKDKPPQYKPVYYSVTKAGVLGLTRYLSTYFSGKNIRVNTLTPGGIFNKHDDEFVKSYSSRTVLGRMARKNEMNGALLFLASDASSYMTGANLVVDGGWTTW